jgi:hypothetical protein
LIARIPGPRAYCQIAAECIRIVRNKLAHLFYRIPRAAISSWLGMEPETFSRNQ